MKKRYCFLLAIIPTTTLALFTNLVLMIEFSGITTFASLITYVLLANIFNIWFNKLYIKYSSYVGLIPMSICGILTLNSLIIGSLYENKTQLFNDFMLLCFSVGFLGLIYFYYKNSKNNVSN